MCFSFLKPYLPNYPTQSTFFLFYFCGFDRVLRADPIHIHPNISLQTNSVREKQWREKNEERE